MPVSLKSRVQAEYDKILEKMNEHSAGVCVTTDDELLVCLFRDLLEVL